jgi:hypothetical protein
MSDPMFSTGATRRHLCQCGTLVTQDECRSAFAGAIHWDTPNHDAPCGLPCLNGGVSTGVYRSGEFHKDADRCLRCKTWKRPARADLSRARRWRAARSRGRAAHDRVDARLRGCGRR